MKNVLAFYHVFISGCQRRNCREFLFFLYWTSLMGTVYFAISPSFNFRNVWALTNVLPIS